MKSFQSQTHYEVLEVSVGATAAEVRFAYERLSQLYSDDQVVLYGLIDAGRAAALRARLREALEVLIDDARRDAYDVKIGLPPRAPARPPPLARPSAPGGAPGVTAGATGWGSFAWVTPVSAPSVPANYTYAAAPAVAAPAPALVVPVPPPPPPTRQAELEPVPRQLTLDVPEPRPSWGARAVAREGERQVEDRAVARPPAPSLSPPPGSVERSVGAPRVSPPATAAPQPAPPSLAQTWAPPPVPVPLPSVPVPLESAPLVPAPEPSLAPPPPPLPAPAGPGPTPIGLSPSTAAVPPPTPAAPPVAEGAEAPVPALSDEHVEVSIVPARSAAAREGRLEQRPRAYEIPEGVEINGDLLRQVRLAKGLTLAQLGERTRIGVKHLENVEGDRYDALPAPVYLRGILMSVARELGLDGLRVSKSYLTFVEAHRSKG